MPEIQDYRGNKVLVLNPGAKFIFSFGAAKARVIIEKKKMISDFLEVLDDILDIRKFDEAHGQYKISINKELDLTPEINVSNKPFKIKSWQAKMILEYFDVIVNFAK
ncbi:hypothetical protein BH10BAC5_BH10BAC5_17180 [soil metagenome]